MWWLGGQPVNPDRQHFQRCFCCIVVYLCHARETALHINREIGNLERNTQDGRPKDPASLGRQILKRKVYLSNGLRQSVVRFNVDAVPKERVVPCRLRWHSSSVCDYTCFGRDACQ
jgi:hypothetical protein